MKDELPLYEIACGDCINDVFEKVNNLISQGYLPHGSLFHTKHKDRDECLRDEYTQPMIKEEDFTPFVFTKLPECHCGHNMVPITLKLGNAVETSWRCVNCRNRVDSQDEDVDCAKEKSEEST